jgi:hypothetical protein
MRMASLIGVVVLAGSVASALPGQQAASASLAASASCRGPFSVVPSPSPGSTDNVLFGTASSGPRAVWAVGRQSVPGGYKNLILFSDGHGWSQVPSPDPGVGDYDRLGAVSASGPSDAWAAGSYATNNPAKPFDPEALHWDGSSWTSVPLPALPGYFNTDTDPGIVDISPTDAWLVGSWDKGSKSVSIIAHWNGTAWSLVSAPQNVVNLDGAAGSGPRDVWAIGTGAGPSFPAVIEHYNGSAWTVSDTLPGVDLGGIASISPAEAWAVGGTSTATASFEWNGTTWSAVPTPNTGSGLTAVSGVSANDVWAIGGNITVEDHLAQAEPLAMHWDGTAWTAVPAAGTAPSSGGFTGQFYAVTAVTASRVIAVGLGTTSADSLVARLCAFPVRDTGFGTSSARVSGFGAAAYWVFPASDKSDHELADASGFHLFDSGMKAPGSSYAFTFPAGGTYPVIDPTDGARENIRVPIFTVGGNPGEATLWLGDTAPPAGAQYQIEDIPPGGTKFVPFGNTKNITWWLSRRLPNGTYKFRSRMRDPSTGAATGWSPALTVTLNQH